MRRPQRRRSAPAPSARRRAEILDAALACFSERGYHGTTMDELAARAGLSKGALYWHFASKREVFLALFERADEELERYRRAAGESSPEAALRIIAEGWLGSAREAMARGEATLGHPAPVLEHRLEILAQATRDPELRSRIERAYAGALELIQGLIERGIRSGSFRPVDARAVATGFLAAYDGLVNEKAVFPELDLEAAWRATEDVFLRGLR